MLHIQFVTVDPKVGYVCQFAEKDDPRVQIRLSHPQLCGLKTIALNAVAHDYGPVESSIARLDRIDDLFNRIAIRELESQEETLRPFLTRREFALFVSGLYGCDALVKLVAGYTIQGRLCPTTAGLHVELENGEGDYFLESDEVFDIRILSGNPSFLEHAATDTNQEARFEYAEVVANDLAFMHQDYSAEVVRDLLTVARGGKLSREGRICRDTRLQYAISLANDLETGDQPVAAEIVRELIAITSQSASIRYVIPSASAVRELLTSARNEEHAVA